MMSFSRWLVPFLALLLLFGACANSTQVAIAERSASTDEIWTVTLPTRRCGDFFLVDVMLNGSGPFAMVLDSGASVSAISESAARKLGLRGRLDEMEFGPVTATNVKVLTRDLDHLKRAFNTEFDGIIGHPVFGKYTVIYDFPAGEVRLTNARLPKSGADIVPTPQPRHPTIAMRIGGSNIRAVVDTGSGRTLSLEKMDDYAFESGPIPLGVSVRFNRKHRARVGRLLEDTTLGPFTLQNLIVHESDKSNLLGQGVLRQFVVSFDQRTAVVQFAQPDEAAEKTITFPSLYGHGAVLSATTEGWFVVDTVDESPAAQAGIRSGDRIVAIDGRLISDLGCEIRDQRDDISREFTLTIDRAGEAIEIQLITEVLVP